MSGLKTLLLGIDPKQRLRAAQSLVVLLLYAAFSLLQGIGLALGVTQWSRTGPQTAWMLAGGVLFYGLIRSGANLHDERDPNLSEAQSLWAMVAICWAYAIVGPARGAVLLILMPLLLFNLFVWTPRRAVVMTSCGFAMLAATMAWKGATDPVYLPRHEVLHVLFSGITLAASALVAMRISGLRKRMQQQRRELAAALQRIQTLAARDELTGLPNRRAMQDRLARALGGGPPAPLALALIDLDHFKRINDAHGHAVGDLVLRRFAELAQAELRGSDVIARWGGEEFLLMMVGADVDQVAGCLQRLRLKLRAEPLDGVQPPLAVGFSAGVAMCRSADDLDAAIDRADAAMYRAKHGGRDRTLQAP